MQFASVHVGAGCPVLAFQGCSSSRQPLLRPHRAYGPSARHSKRRSRQCRHCLIRAESDSSSNKLDVSLAPVQPKSPVGQMVTYYLKMEPHLFKAAVEEQFQRLQKEKEETAAAEKAKEEAAQAPNGDKGDLVLYRRMQEVRRSEQRATVEDLMYASVLEKFVELGVDMLPRLDTLTPTKTYLKELTEGIHSREALDMVREHVLSVMGPANMAYDNTMLKMSKLQAAQVYAASIMFGYFVRRVDKRFQLERSIGLLNDKDEAVARLERLFSQASDAAEDEDLDRVSSGSQASSSQGSTGSTNSSTSSTADSAQTPSKQKGSALRKYIEQFDQQTLMKMARLVSQEGAALVEIQTSALFGDLRKLQEQMQQAVGQEAVNSMEDLMQRVQDAVSKEMVESLTLTVGTQRRAVLEAIAFGTFLRDVESHVDEEYQLLTPVSSASGRGPQGPPMAGV